MTLRMLTNSDPDWRYKTLIQGGKAAVELVESDSLVKELAFYLAQQTSGNKKVSTIISATLSNAGFKNWESCSISQAIIEAAKNFNRLGSRRLLDGFLLS